ncbi:MAG: hypothetical protein M5U26_17805 [Planctomycetota bacterium]|nr:hypothetical protein [Planctomycetota bacterium]
MLVGAACAPLPGLRAEESETQPRSIKVERLGEGAEKSQVGQAANEGLISLHVRERPLKVVLDYLSTVSGKNIRALTEEAERLPVTVDLDNVTYLTVLDFIAKKYALQVDDSKINQNLVTISIPEKVSMVFNRADIRDVISTIAIQANANIVVGPEVSGEISMRIENVPWQDALQIVVKTLDFVTVQEANDTIRITTRDKLKSQLENRIFFLAYMTPEGAKYTATLATEFARREGGEESTRQYGSTLIDLLGSMKTGDGKLSFVKRQNALVVQDTSTSLDSMEQVIRKLDVAPKQIHVAVKIVALNDDDQERLGVQWSSGLQFQVSPLSSWPSAFPFDVTKGLTRSLLGDLTIGQGARNVVDQSTGNTVAINDIFTLRKSVGTGGDSVAGNAGYTVSNLGSIVLGSMGFGTTSAFFEAVKSKTSGRVVQAPQLMTLDNEEATIQVGTLFRYAESFVANTEGGGNVSGFREANGSPIKLGIQLLIIPHVTGPENNILMTVIPKTEDLLLDDGGRPKTITGPSGEQLVLPDTVQRIVVTKMLLRNGETGVIGGLRTDQDNRSETKVPGLGEIPIIGRLFKHRARGVSGDSLMIFVTPTIVDLERQEDFKSQLERLRSKMTKSFAPLGEEENGEAGKL